MLSFETLSRVQLFVTGRLAAYPRVVHIAAGTALFLLVRPIFGLLHEMVVLGVSELLQVLADAPVWRELVASLPLDPVYTLAMVRFAGEIEATGVAVAGPSGQVLKTVFPGIFAAREPMPGAWASAVIEPGATVLARSLTGFSADVVLLSIGVLMFLAGWLRGKAWLLVCGALQQAHLVLYHFLDAGVSLRNIEAAGLPFAMASLVSDPSQRAPWFTNGLSQLPEPLIAAGAGVLLLIVSYAAAASLVAGTAVLWRLLTRAASRPSSGTSNSRPLRYSPAMFFGASALALAATPLGTFAEAETCVLERGAPTGPLTCKESAEKTSVGHPLPLFTAPISLSALSQKSGPTRVSFLGQDYQYQLFVNGRAEVVRGMGYNAEYASLPGAERSALYDRDFAHMRSTGVNSIFGWFQAQFDDVTLARARQHGIGVGMPFELNQDLDYDDPLLRARLTREVLDYVARYKDDPAVWFWTPGNEVIHRLIFPSWLRRERDQVREARADSFARFYVELIDQIHALDPNHPVIYRDAEEVYLSRIRENLLKDGKPRPWFAYGTNVYSGRLSEILASWPSQGLDVPLLVSEFSPGGTGPDDRPEGLRNMWQTIRTHSDWVMGGVVYTWTTEGPEELDRVFGLVDAAGQPRDGSLTALAELYRADVVSR